MGELVKEALFLPSQLHQFHLLFHSPRETRLAHVIAPTWTCCLVFGAGESEQIGCRQCSCHWTSLFGWAMITSYNNIKHVWLNWKVKMRKRLKTGRTEFFYHLTPIDESMPQPEQNINCIKTLEMCLHCTLIKNFSEGGDLLRQLVSSL